jgi:hypothetical protein
MATSTKTHTSLGLVAGLLGVLFWTSMAFFILGKLGMKSDSSTWVNLLPYLLICAVILIAQFWFSEAIVKRFAPPQPRLSSVEDRLDELDRLKRRDLVTPEEYAAKRQEILKDL